MELLNLNDEIRNTLLNIIDKSTLKGISIDDTISQYCEELYSWENTEQDMIKSYREFAISVLYLDAFKMLLYKLKTCIVGDKEYLLYNRINSIENVDDLLSEISADPEFFSAIVKEAYQFCSLEDIGKSIVVKSLSNVQNMELSQIVSAHRLDVLVFSKKITKDDIVSYLMKIHKYQSSYFVEFREDSIIINLTGYIKMLKIYDEENYRALLLEIGIIDYYVSKYLCDKYNDNDILLEHVDYYENYSIADIRKKLSLNQEFLLHAIDMLYSLYIDGNYEEIHLKEDILYSNDKMNKKLFLKQKKDD